MAKSTTRKIKAGQDVPAETLSAHKPVRPADEAVGAVAALRARHEANDAGLMLDDLEPTNLGTLSMERRPHGDGEQSPFVPDGGLGFIGHATTD